MVMLKFGFTLGLSALNSFVCILINLPSVVLIIKIIGKERHVQWDKELTMTPSVCKPGKKRFVRPIDEFLMTCKRLILALRPEHLEEIFVCLNLLYLE